MARQFVNIQQIAEPMYVVDAIT